MNEHPRLSLLGVPALTDRDGLQMKFRTRKHLALLVFLALDAQKRSVTRAELVDLLWPDANAMSLHSLSQALMDIKAKLGADAIESDRKHVQLKVALPTDLDAHDFGSLPSHIPTPLQGFETYAGSLFAQWVDVARDRILSRVHARLSAELFDARTCGRVQAVSERAEQLYSVDPYNSAAVQALVGDRLASGDSAGALRLFRKYINESTTELGFTPSSGVVASLRRFERHPFQDPRNDLAAARHNEPGAVPPQLFIGRESEMARLQDLSHDVMNGLFRTCALKGPDGIGKTTMLRRTVWTAAAGNAVVYLVNCQEMGQRIPFAAISDLLEQMSRDPSLGGTEAIWLAEASRISPSIRATYPGVPEPPETPPETVRVRIGEALKSMLDVISDGCPVFLAFDDMHYMDPASRDVLHMFARRLGGTATLLLAAARCSETELGSAGGAAISGVEWQDTIDVFPLAPGQIGELISARARVGESVDDAVIRKIVELAQGNPLLSELLLSDWRNNGSRSLVMVDMSEDRGNVEWSPPDTMSAVLATQYRGLSKSAKRLVHLLATAGRAMPFDDITRLLALPSDTVGSAVFALIERGIICLDANALTFTNALHREFVYSELPKETRKYQHAHLAQHLRAAKDQNEFQHALEASHHFLKAGWIDEARELACFGAERAITWGAPQEAQKALEAVIDMDPHSTFTPLHLFLARALGALGKYQDALNALAAWQPTTLSQNEEALAAAVRAEALHRGRLEDDETIKQAIDGATSLAEKSGDDSLFLSTLQLSAEWASETGDTQARDLVRATTQRIGQSSRHAATKALASLSQGYCLLVAGDAAQAEQEFRSCVKTLSELHLDPELRQVYNGIGVACYCMGAMDRSASAFKDSIDMAARIGDSVAAATSWSNLGAVHEDLGDFDRARSCYEQALSLGQIATNPRRAVEFHLNAAGLELITDNIKAAGNSVTIARRWAEESRLWWLKADVSLAEADICLARGMREMAWSMLEEAQRAMMNRVYALANRGRYERLRRHHIFAVHGLPAMLHLVKTEDLERQCFQLTGRLEVRAFEEWARMQVDATYDASDSAVEELQARGLLGVLRRLTVLGYTTG